MASKKQLAWRKIFAEKYGKKKREKRGVSMARKKIKTRSRRGRGLLSTGLVKGALFGVAGGLLGRLLKVNPFLTSAVGGYFGAGLKGALVGAGTEFLGVGNMLQGAVGGVRGRTAGVKLYG